MTQREQAKIGVLSREIERERARSSATRRENGTLMETITALNDRIAALEAKLREAHADVRSWEDKETRKAMCCMDNEQRAIKAEADLADIRARIAALEAELLEARENDAKAKKHAELLAREITVGNTERNDLRARLAAAEERAVREYAEWRVALLPRYSVRPDAIREEAARYLAEKK